MKNIRPFILFSSLVLAAWLGASYMTEVTISQDPSKTADSSTMPSETVKKSPATDVELGATTPVAHFE